MEAEDAVQDTFCNLWVAEMSDADARFRLFAVLKNVCINKLRRKRHESGVEDLEIPVEVPDNTDVDFLKNELLSHLTPLQKKIFCMSLYDEMEYEEIAVALGMTVEAMRTNMCRARKILREQYNKLKQ